jgi:hypothetical protein
MHVRIRHVRLPASHRGFGTAGSCLFVSHRAGIFGTAATTTAIWWYNGRANRLSLGDAKRAQPILTVTILVSAMVGLRVRVEA